MHRLSNRESTNVAVNRPDCRHMHMQNRRSDRANAPRHVLSGLLPYTCMIRNHSIKRILFALVAGPTTAGHRRILTGIHGAVGMIILKQGRVAAAGGVLEVDELEAEAAAGAVGAEELVVLYLNQADDEAAILVGAAEYPWHVALEVARLSQQRYGRREFPLLPKRRPLDVHAVESITHLLLLILHLLFSILHHHLFVYLLHLPAVVVVLVGATRVLFLLLVMRRHAAITCCSRDDQSLKKQKWVCEEDKGEEERDLTCMQMGDLVISVVDGEQTRR